MSFRILVSDRISPQGVEILERQAEVVQTSVNDYDGEIDAIIVRSRTKLDKNTIARFSPRLKVIGRAGVGVDNIDLDAAHELGVRVVNTPEATTMAVAEHTLGLMLALARHIPEGNASMKSGNWEKANLIGSSLGGKTLGIIGVGRIGSALAVLVQGFRMKVLGTDPYKGDTYVRSRGVEPVEFDELLGRADFISVHVPLNDETRELINREALSKVKPGAYLVSTARGGIVAETALLSALEHGRLAGAAMDVFEKEPPGLSALVQHPQVIVTPHIAAQTLEAQVQTGVDIANEVLSALSDKPTRWEIKPNSKEI